MAEFRKNGPYIWVTWLLVWKNSCEWAAWFRTQHESWSWERVSRGFDLAGWQLAHTLGVNENRQRWEELGYTVYTEDQNSLALKGNATRAEV